MTLHTDAESLRDLDPPLAIFGRGQKSGASRPTNRRGVREGRRPRALNAFSRLWLERHGGSAAASVLSAALQQPSALDIVFPGWDEPSDQPLSMRERDLLRAHLDRLSDRLLARERYVIARTLGSLGQPEPLTRVARDLGVTRERTRQIEHSALRKLGIALPRGKHRSPSGRRRRARLLLQTLILA
jgi:hypothetical protein